MLVLVNHYNANDDNEKADAYKLGIIKWRCWNNSICGACVIVPQVIVKVPAIPIVVGLHIQWRVVSNCIVIIWWKVVNIKDGVRSAMCFFALVASSSERLPRSLFPIWSREALFSQTLSWTQWVAGWFLIPQIRPEPNMHAHEWIPYSQSPLNGSLLS